MNENHAINILVLDDESFMLKLLGTMLANLGYVSVKLYDNGQTVLDHIDASNAVTNLILLDLNMPGMDGVEFVRHLVARSYDGSLILVSGEDERILQAVEKLVKAHKIPVLGHLQKPVTVEKLSALLSKWVPPAQGSTRMAKKVYTAEEVRYAIHNNELVNYYQPKVVVATGELVGVETLVRWRHPHDGMVFPDQFIGVAEANNLINELTQVVLAGALTQANIWKQAGLMLRVAVNVSMGNLNSLDFPDMVAGLAAESGVQPQQVVLEVTESQLMLDQRAPLDILTRLRLKRFRLSIDDFGTGHSSLSQLRDIPFDELKIDQGFVHGAWANETLRAIYDASLRLSRQLNMVVVAEGVEDRADWDFVQQTGCDLAQGYFIARPMPAEDIHGWIEDWNERASAFI